MARGECPKTGDSCPVIANLDTMKVAIRSAEEILALGALRSTVVNMLERGHCAGMFSENGDRDDNLYSGLTYFCANDRLPDIAREVDDADEDPRLGYSEIFDIENIGKVRALHHGR
jgi:hypothetical protein